MLNVDIAQLLQAAASAKNSGNAQRAEQLYRQILRQDPTNIEAIKLLSALLYEAYRSEEAVALLRTAVQINPTSGWTHNDLGNCLREIGRHDEALACFQRALALMPQSAAIHNNLGLALMDLRRHDESVQSWRTALALDPNLQDAHWNLSLTLLLMGNMEEGWQHYEWRTPVITERRFTQPKWDGSDLENRRILVHAEQGLGDTIQFARYIRQVAERGGHVILGCPPPLQGLLETVRGVSEIAPFGGPMPAFDVHVSLMSLPGIFQTRVENIPAEIPYLTVPHELKQQWGGVLSTIPGFRVGIIWQGNPGNITAAKRSFHLPMFEPLAKIKNVRLISLQKDASLDELAAAREKFEILEPLTHEVWNARTFLDTAAIMQNLDLVISADTATCHLAGALGVKVWTPIPVANDWRWLMHREDTPWYPTMRLWRQKTDGEWADVFAGMAAELQSRAQAAQT